MATTAAPWFRVGKKELFLPRANITLLRTALEPHFAKFRVPLSFSKLDLRDYLWHVYAVRILSVRSYVKQQRVRQGDPDVKKPQPKRWNRPRAHKHMTVELARPFRWPDAPDDYREWNTDEVEASEAMNKEQRDERSPTRDTIIKTERREKMKEQAKALLEGKVKWTSPVADAKDTLYHTSVTPKERQIRPR